MKRVVEDGKKYRKEAFLVVLCVCAPFYKHEHKTQGLSGGGGGGRERYSNQFTVDVYSLFHYIRLIRTIVNQLFLEFINLCTKFSQNTRTDN